jgi:hypothetical protein
LFRAEEVRQHDQAFLKIHELYKKPEVFKPVSATLETMWQDRQMGSLIKSLPWPLHNPNHAHKISYIEDPHPMPTMPSLYTGDQDMIEEQRKKYRRQFLSNCAKYMEHRYKDWVDTKGYYELKNLFWIDHGILNC